MGSYKRNGLTWISTWTEDRIHAIFGVFSFPDFGRDTGPCETQIVVLSVVQETKTQNYIIIIIIICSFAI